MKEGVTFVKDLLNDNHLWNIRFTQNGNNLDKTERNGKCWQSEIFHAFLMPWELKWN